MSRSGSGKRYAQAAFELALERGELDDWRAGLKKMASMALDRELVALLENPRLSFTARKALMEDRLGDIGSLVINLCCLLVSRGKLNLASSISQEYDRLLDARRGIEHAEVVTAFPLEDGDKELISHRLGNMVGRKVVIDARTDPSIIGGFRARVGDMLIDDSIRYRMELLRKDLLGG